MALTILTLAHTAISLVGIAAGLVVALGMLKSLRLDGWTAVFLWTTVLTSVTGFFFPFHGFLPSHGVAIVSLLVLPAAIVARYRRGMRGPWRPTYVIASVLALYLNVFVLVVQAFLKVPPLHELAPKQTEPPFLATQGVVLVLFLALGAAATVRFRPDKT